MANIIQHKRSSTATTIPTSGQLSAGELAVNTADGKLYLKKDNATIVQIGGPVAAADLTGATLASGVTASSLTSVGALTSLTVNNTGVKVGEHGTKFLSITSDGTNNAITQNGNSTLSINHSNNGSIYIGDSDGNNNSTYIDVNDADTTIILHGEVSGTSTTASTSSTTGALIVSGGVGIAKDSHINSQRIGVGLLQDTTNLAVGANALAATIASGIRNTAIGSGCGSSITSGTQNTLLGYAVGTNVTTGAGNCSIGYVSLNQNTVGNYNTAMGYGALENTTASNNTAVGLAALGNITTGALNTAVGREAGRFQADGTTALTTANNSVYLGRDTRGTQTDSNSVVIGYQAIGLGANTTVIGTSSTTAATIRGALSLPSTTASTSSTTGALIVSGGVGIAKDSHINGHRIGQGLLATQTNLAVGTSTLNSTIAGGLDNTALGYVAGSNITTGANNVMLGSNAGFGNTTGISNLCIGTGSHYKNTTGSYTVAIGDGAGHEINSASVYNAFIGTYSGYNLTSGNNLVCIGGLAGYYQANGATSLTASSNSVYIGYNAKGFNNSDSNSIVIGSGAIGLGANTTVVGTSSTTANKIFGVSATGEVAPTIASAGTIAPTKQITFVSGTTAIVTITAPTGIATTGGQITLIPTGIFTTTAAGNIALASTAVVSRALIMTYDATTAKWYPSY